MVEFFLSTVKECIVNQIDTKLKQDFLLRSLFAECKKNLEIICYQYQVKTLWIKTIEEYSTQDIVMIF